MSAPLEQVRIAIRLRRLLRERRRYDALPAEARARWREDRLHALRAHAVARSPLYAARLRGDESAPLEALPTTSKADLVERFDEVVTDRELRLEHLRGVVEGGAATALARGRYRVGASSGSTGRPGLLPFDEAEWTGLIANAARGRALAGSPGVEGRTRSAKVGSPAPWHLSRQVAATLQDPRKPSLSLSAATDVRLLAAELDGWRPHVLAGYPSALVALAHEQVVGRLDISPAQVFGSGEPFTAGARERVAAAWGGEPFDQYVTTEAGFVAVECVAHDGLHVLDDHVVVEVVDATGRATLPGELGAKVLLTVLGSRTVPLIRYEVDDAAVLADGDCACGRQSPRLVGVTGRARDLLRFRGAGGTAVVVHPVTLTSVLDVAPVGGWQVVQEPGRLRVLVVDPAPSFSAEAIVGALAMSLARAGVDGQAVGVEVVERLERAGSGKASLIVTSTGRTGAGTGS